MIAGKETSKKGGDSCCVPVSKVKYGFKGSHLLSLRGRQRTLECDLQSDVEVEPLCV